MPLYEFRCAEGHVTERLASRDTELVSCPCGQAASRQSVYKFGFTGFSRVPLDQRTYDLRHVQEAGAELDYAESRQTDVEGKPQPSVNLWNEAKSRANQLQKLGVKDSADL